MLGPYLEQRPRVVGTREVGPQLAAGDRRPADLLQPRGDERGMRRDGVLNHGHRNVQTNQARPEPSTSKVYEVDPPDPGPPRAWSADVRAGPPKSQRGWECRWTNQGEALQTEVEGRS